MTRVGVSIDRHPPFAIHPLIGYGLYVRLTLTPRRETGRSGVGTKDDIPRRRLPECVLCIEAKVNIKVR